MKRIIVTLLILALTTVSIAGLLATPAAARIFSVQPTNEDGGPPTDQFTTADPIFAVFRADLEGGRICVVDSEGRESHCKIISAYIGTGWSFIARGLPQGTYRLRASDPGYEFFSFPFTVSPCTDPDCAERRRMSDEVVDEWKHAASETYDHLNHTSHAIDVLDFGTKFHDAHRVIADAQGPKDAFTAELIAVGGAFGFGVGFTFFPFDVPTSIDEAYIALAQEVSSGAQQMYKDIKDDPPDPDFDEVAAPVFTNMPGTGDVEHDRLLLTLDRQRAFGRAQLKAYERYLGAVAAGDEAAARMQAQAVADYGESFAAQMKESAAALRSWGASLDPDRPVITQSQLDDVASIYDRVRASGFTQDELNQLAAAGLSPEEVEQVRAVFNEDIRQVPTGVPMPTILNQAADALEANIPAVTTFSQEAAWVADGRAPKSISLSPASASLSVGATHTLSAAVTNGRGAAVAGVLVALSVKGANPVSLSATTDAGGVAAFSYVGANPGVDTLSATAGTAASNVATANWSAHVNSPPVLELSNYQTYEGFGSFSTSFTDPDPLDTHTATIDWGDGSPVQPLLVQESGGSGLVFANHSYADDGQFNITVTVADNHGGVASGVAPMNVQNATPTVFPVGFTTNNRLFKLGDTITAATSFFDNGPHDTHTARWDWGDGTTTPAVFTETGGTVTLYESHTYTTPGVYLVRLFVTDDDGATGVGEAIETIGFFKTVNEGSIKPLVTETGKISASISGLGMTGQDGALKVKKPAGATVRKAFMAAATRGFFGYLLRPGDVKLDNVAVRWDIATPSAIQAYNFWGEVTEVVKAKVDSAPAGEIDLSLREENSNMTEGEVLVVIFDDPNQPKDNTVALLFGAQQTTGNSFPLRFAQPLDLSNPDFALTMSLGISFGHQDQFGQQYSVIDVNGRRITTSAGGEDDGEVANGALLTVGGLGDSPDNPSDPYALPRQPRDDDELYDLRRFVSAGDTELMVTTSNPSNDDNIFFAAFFLQNAAAVVGEGIVLTPVSATPEVGTRHTLTATAQDARGNLLQGREVTFEVLSGPHAGLSGTATTDAQGLAQFTYVGNRAGTDTVVASFVNSEGRAQTSNTVTAEWKGRAVTPTVISMSPASGTYGGTTELSARLTAEGVPLGGRELTFSLNSITVGVARTDASGIATVPNVSLAGVNEGTYPEAVAARFAGETGRSASGGTATLTIGKATSRVVIDTEMFANGGPAILTASLLDSGSFPMANRALMLALGEGASAQACAATADAVGRASCRIERVAQPLGPGVVSGSFAGDTNYLPSAGVATTLIFDYPKGAAGGSFVIGDLNAVVGREVTFWGAQWSKANALSGGAAPSNFKGFANQTGTNPATCGTTWTTGTGNSSGPPSSLPPYMAVIVSNSITKTGSTVLGNVSRIVIVKTNPGYDSDPGHAGTGTVVAVWCP